MPVISSVRRHMSETWLELSIGEPWDFQGPDGANRVLVTFEGLVHGPDVPNWQSEYALLKVERPFTWRDERVELLLAGNRYAGCNIRDVIRGGGTVGVSRLRTGIVLKPGERFKSEDVEYIIIGSLRPIARYAV